MRVCVRVCGGEGTYGCADVQAFTLAYKCVAILVRVRVPVDVCDVIKMAARCGSETRDWL